MRRKIIKQGNNSYTFTIPIDWIKENNLKGGDEIDIEEEESKLLISLPTNLKKAEITLNIDMSNYNKRSITIALHQAYRKGFDKINITYGTPEQLEMVKNITKNTLLGFEIVGETEKKCTIQNIAEPSTEKFEVILRKVMLLIKEESKTILESLKTGKWNLNKRVEIKNMFNNLNNFCRRLIIKDKKWGSKNSYLLFYFVSHMTLIEHSYYYLIKTCDKTKQKKLDKDIIDLMKRVNGNYEVLYNAFYKKDLIEAHRTRKISDELLNEIQEKIAKQKGTRNSLLLIISSIVRNIGVATTVLFGLDFEAPIDMMK